MTVWSSPALGAVDGRPVLAIGSYDRNVYLLDAASGQPIWHYTTGNGVYESPLIWRDGSRTWVFAASSDRLVYGLNAADGARIWSQALADYQPTTGGSRLSAPCLGLVGGQPALFVGHWVWDKSLANSTQRGGLTALDARTGRRLWQVDFLDNRVSTPVWAVIEGRGRVLVASEDGNLRALAAETGQQIWAHRETEPIMASPLVFDSPQGARVAIGSHFGKLRCLDAATGRQLWSFKAGHWVTGTAALLRLADRRLIAFGSYDQRLYTVDATSGQRVSSQFVGGPIHSSPAILPDERDPLIVLAAWDHQVYALDARDGGLRFSVFVGLPIWDAITQGESNWASPVVARVGEHWMIYHGSLDGALYAIPISQAAQTSPAAPWASGRFWWTMVLSLGLSAGLALWLTRRARRRSGPGGVGRSGPIW
jgi:outer membrane protein assembly factor BamB